MRALTAIDVLLDPDESMRAFVLQPSIGIAVIEVAPGPEILSLQARLIEALQPYTERGGTAEAFVRTAAEPEIGDETIAFIEDYVPQHSGVKYVAHVTVGLAAPEDLAVLEAAPFSPFTFAADALSIYQLGNAGAAARCLHSWRG